VEISSNRKKSYVAGSRNIIQWHSRIPNHSPFYSDSQSLSLLFGFQITLPFLMYYYIDSYLFYFVGIKSEEQNQSPLMVGIKSLGPSWPYPPSLNDLRHVPAILYSLLGILYCLLWSAVMMYRILYYTILSTVIGCHDGPYSGSVHIAERISNFPFLHYNKLFYLTSAISNCPAISKQF
jgi:hypothetical protein